MTRPTRSSRRTRSTTGPFTPRGSFSRSSRSTPTELRDPGVGLAEHRVRLPDGRHLRCVTGGTTGPLVLLECGLGNTAGTWVTVQRLLSATCRTIAYDRAGIGGSDVDTHPRSLTRMADDLAALLDALAVEEPVVLVGHSWGGPLIRVLAERRPEHVRALMLIDPTIAAVKKWVRPVRPLYLKLIWKVRMGGRERLLHSYRTGRWAQEMPPQDLKVAFHDFMTSANLQASWQEIRPQMSTWPELIRLESSPSAVPIRFLVGVDRPDPLRTVMAEGCARIAALSPVGGTVLVADAGHSIPQERPVRTAREIDDFVSGLPQ
ncbi:alpha/beta fold hydrolase [Streptomyces sp. NPDC056352]|uniref:alpha/beta fold hydrolase n=1 Tax=Streptomyces sp. NPDC056352 TaxID=3345791 RepID=UPI0035D6E5BE